MPVAEGAQRDNTEARSRREPRHSEPRRPENRPAEARGGISGGAGNSDRVANRQSVTESAEPS